MTCDGKDVFVAATTHVHDQQVIFRKIGRDFHHMCQRVGGFKRGNDPFKRAGQLERLKRFFVRDADVLRAANIVEP